MSTATVATRWYEFSQNNSGGYYSNDPERGVGHVVMVEAIDGDHANRRAERLGIEFGTGCQCCGSRWSGVIDSDGEEECVQAWGGAIRAHRPDEEPEIYLGEEHLIFVHPINGDFYRGAKDKP